MVLAPGILAAVVLLVGISLIGQDAYLYVAWGVAVLALICLTLVVQAKKWIWAPFLAIVAVLWNPVVPLAFDGTAWLMAHYAAVALFLAAGTLVKTPLSPEDAARR